MSNTPIDMPRVALLIFAHDESFVIEKTVTAACKALETGDAIFVVADHCTDDTASCAEKAGAQVFIRDHGSAQGKGAALVWFIKYQWHVLYEFNRVVILDADSFIESDFIKNIKGHLDETEQVMQCFVSPIEYEHSPISTLIAFSEMVEQSVFERIKSKLGWPIRLRGTGMVVSPKDLLSVSNQVETEVEDIALTLLFAEKNFKIKPLADVLVYDPKPVAALAASRQRARWFRGQWAALWHYRNATFKIISQGLGGWSLISSLFFKPRWLMMALKITLAVASIRMPGLTASFLFLLSIDLILYMVGFFQLKEKMPFLKAFIYFPGFVLMWLASIFLSFQRLPWLRVRESKIAPGSIGMRHPEPIKTIKLN